MKTQKVGKNINMTYDFECTATQNISDLPFGEDWVDLRNISWDYHGIHDNQFSGKEKDAETGLNYFGARYYDSDLSIWLSVDPLADKYPGISPYAYCANNPIKLVDPDGREILPASKTEKQAYEKFRARVFSNKNYSKVQEELVRLENSDEIFKIRIGENMSNTSGGGNFIFNPNTNELDINISNYGDFTVDEKLAHELKHAIQYLDEKIQFGVDNKKNVYTLKHSENNEREAYGRQNQFSNNPLSSSNIDKFSKGANKTISPSEFNSYKKNNKQYFEHFGCPQIVYSGWKNDIKE